ncbi:MAG: 8-amino-7-oxononanoate synthase [Syntrophorhabdus sp. PtaU1.Bin002]|nr:MAG: 8-amino-7-oxononanoate synthase [Syntrophorhabdus sp. PtaB.Bin006]OPY70381.1 MAG: 8-amino-7-oxononanoate synthase [Syntrophorhabdus sp. PtaU1.Bin002]
MKERLSETLRAIQDKGNYRTLKYLVPLPGTRTRYEGREYLNLCSNSYLSLHNHPVVIEGAKKAIDEYGAGTCSSRSVSGSIDLYRIVEDETARYKGYDKGLIFSNGYMANIGIISTLTEEGDVIFSDELNHSSLIDSMRLSRARTTIYKHRDMDDLEKKLKRTRVKGKKFIVTESVFSMDGDIAPLRDIYRLKNKYDAYVMVDDAHGTGVFGDKGTGVEELCNLMGSMDIHMATFGKALGSFGAFVLSDQIVIEYLVNRARTFMYTTALPAAALGAGLAALRLIRDDTSFKEALWANIDYMRTSLTQAGFDLKDSEGPIVPIVVGEDKKTVTMQEMLMEKGLFLQAIRPPTVPEGTSRLRLTIVRGFTRSDMDFAIDSLKDAGKKLGLIE